MDASGLPETSQPPPDGLNDGEDSKVDAPMIYKHGRNLVFLFDATSVTSSVDPNIVKGTRGKRSRYSTEPSDSDSSFSSSDSYDDGKVRENWSGRLDFLLSCIGFAVGLGNIWRFPYLCYKSGGGAFLLPYTVFLLLCGLPLFFMEVSLGQFASLSPIAVWRIVPLFKGIGYGMVIISGLVCIYYNIILTWTFYYLFETMRETIPWSGCDQPWNTDRCVVEITSNTTQRGAVFKSGLRARDSQTPVTASEEFWSHQVLQLTSGIDDMGEIRWPLFGCLALAWTIVFLCLCKGVKSSGKVVKVTATFPYLVLTILLVRGLTLPGAMDGIRFYLIPDFEKVLLLRTWADAATQIFYSVGMAWGGLITMSSYNKFDNNVFKDAMIVPLLNCGTSVFAGFVIFSVLGFMSHSTGLDVEDVATSGPGLIFVVYPQAVAKMPVPQFWAILFFLMIFTIGLDSQFAMFETMTSAFIDEFPHHLRHRKTLFTLFMCMVEFILGIPLVFDGGVYILTIMDWYASVFSLMLLSFLECILISWVYGVDRFMSDIQLMIGSKPNAYWKLMWKFVTPCVILFIWISSLMRLKNATYGNYQYPDWAIVCGWTLALCSVVPLPLLAIIKLSQEQGTMAQRFRKLLQPAANWGPAQPSDREQYVRSFTQFERERYMAAQQGIDRQTLMKSLNKSASMLSAMPPDEIRISVTPDELSAHTLSRSQ